MLKVHQNGGTKVVPQGIIESDSSDEDDDDDDEDEAEDTAHKHGARRAPPRRKPNDGTLLASDPPKPLLVCLTKIINSLQYFNQII